MAKTLSMIVSHVKLVDDDPKQPRRYQFEDLEQVSHKTRYKSKTDFRSDDVKVGDHVILFTLTDWVKKRGNSQNHSIVVNDLKHAENLYRWIVKHNPGVNVEVQWRGKLTVL